MSAYFITGTGTDIGKTWLSCALLRHWLTAGATPTALKPILSGFAEYSLSASDAGKLLLALQRPLTMKEVAAITPWRFSAPLAPDQAAAMEGRAIDFSALIAFCHRITSTNSWPVLVEGVGGVMVPLDAQHTVRDWIAALAIPAVLVTGSYLGSLSHTLTALVALQAVGVPVAAVVVNESPGSSVSLEATQASLSAFIGEIPLVAIARAEPQAGVVRLSALLS